MKKLFLLLLFACSLNAQVGPPPASPAEVAAGTDRYKYLTPYGVATSGISSNGITAAGATNIIEGMRQDAGFDVGGTAAAVTSITNNADEIAELIDTRPTIDRSGEPPLVILDQDFTTDEGDSHGLKMALALMDRNLIKVIAVGTTLTNEGSAAGVAAYLNYYGYPEIPVGVNKTMLYALGSSVNGTHFTLAEVAAKAKYPPYSLYNSNYPAAYKVYRKALSAAPNSSVVIDVEGDSRNIYQLWNSVPDEISALTGQQLCEAKVKYFFSNSGSTNSGILEYNLTADQAAAEVWNDITVPVVWMWWEVAQGTVGHNVGNTDIHPKDSPIYQDGTNYSYRTAGSYPWREPWDAYAKFYMAAARNIADGTNWIDGQSLFSISAPMRMDYKGGGWIAISNTSWSGKNLNQYYLLTNGVVLLQTNLANGFIDAPPYRTGNRTNAPKDFKWTSHSMNAVAWGSGLLAATTGMTYSRVNYGGGNSKMTGVTDWLYTDLGSRAFAIAKNLDATVTQAVCSVTLFAVTNDSYNFTSYSGPYFTATGFQIGSTDAARPITNVYNEFYTVKWTNSWFGAGLTNIKQMRGYFDAQLNESGAAGNRYIINVDIGVKRSDEP